MISPQSLSSIEPQGISRLANALNVSRAKGARKFSEEDATALSFGVHTVLAIVDHPEILPRLIIDEGLPVYPNEVYLNTHERSPIDVRVSSKVLEDEVVSTVVIVNKLPDSALVSVMIRIVQDRRESNQIVGFTVCVVTDDNQEKDKPVARRLLNRILTGTGITELSDGLSEACGVSAVYTVITPGNGDGIIHVEPKNRAGQPVDLPLSLSMLADVDLANFSDKIIELTSSMLPL